MRRFKRLMPNEEARSWLQSQRVIHVATTDDDGWPYVIPLVFIYPGARLLYFHTGAHEGSSCIVSDAIRASASRLQR